MEIVEIPKESKYFLQKDADNAIDEALKQNEPLIVSNAIKSLSTQGVKLILDGVEGYKTLRENLNNKDTAKLQLKLVLVFDDTKTGQELKNALKSDLKGFGYGFIIVDWETDILKSGNISEAVKKAVENIKNIVEIKKEIKKTNIDNNFNDLLKHMEEDGNTPAIKTGFNRFDEALGGGLRNGRLYAIGAISSLGKTSFALNLADNIAAQGRDILIFSLEMSTRELVAKSISRETFKLNRMDIHNHKAKTALQLTDHLHLYPQEEQEIMGTAISNYKQKVAKHMNISEGVGNIGVRQIRDSIAIRLQVGEPKPIVIVDYMQILATYNERMTDKQNTDKNITELKRISRDYNIPVIVISSFNRSNYLNEVSFESFKESGSIEYSVDVLIGLQLKINGREDWADKTPALNEKRKAVNEAKDKCPREIELVILKNRMYKAWSKIDLGYYPQFDYFEEISNEFVAT